MPAKRSRASAKKRKAYYYAGKEAKAKKVKKTAKKKKAKKPKKR